MILYDLLREDFEVKGNHNKEISSISYNSKEIERGSLFVAIKGQSSDGHNFIEEAISKGAVSIVYEKKYYSPKNDPQITWIGVDDSRDALAWFSSIFYGNPSKKMHLIGITGTNGKTTTSYLIRHVLKKLGKKTGVVGTIRYLIDAEEIKAPHTTPESLQFQKLLKEMLDKEVEYVVAEVSSHALSLKRVDYTQFEVAVFTNLSRDHLDFHRDMEDYFQSKCRLFKELLKEEGIAVINIDDAYGKRLANSLEKKKICYGVENSEADIYVNDYRLGFDGTDLNISISGEKYFFKTPLIGIPNIYNTLSAIGVCLALHIPVDTIKEALLSVKAPEGRFENINEGQDFFVFVDYAHTPDALERLLGSVNRLREKIHKTGRIITLFGCGGNRDRGKRPQMGKIATDLSDYVILTSDNPRWENPRDIIRDIEDGISKDNYIVVPDRKEALKVGLTICEKGDIFIVAGKGHEDYQEIEGKRIPFSDREAIRNMLKEMKK